jgi:hypothetical protein
MRRESLVPLTLEEHRELGAEIRATAARLKELADVVIGVYGPNNQAAFGFQRLVETLERLQKDLQAQASRDLPGVPVDRFYV